MNGRLPPRVPTEEQTILLALGFLSHFARRGLAGTHPWARNQLSVLCGAVPPTKKEALRWRTGLRALLREVRAEPDDEAMLGGTDALRRDVEAGTFEPDPDGALAAWLAKP